jgi:hypothetical protein
MNIRVRLTLSAIAGASIGVLIADSIGIIHLEWSTWIILFGLFVVSFVGMTVDQGDL